MNLKPAGGRNAFLHVRGHSAAALTYTFVCLLGGQGLQDEIQRVWLAGAIRKDELGEVRGLAHPVDD